MANKEHLKILKQGAGVGAPGQGDGWLGVEDANRLLEEIDGVIEAYGGWSIE